jgi:hypothetical protein
MSTSCNTTDKTYTYRCTRTINGSKCNTETTKEKYAGSFHSRCTDCLRKCEFVDKHGTTCEKSTFGRNEYCTKHFNIVCAINNYDGWKKSIEFRKEYVYCGEHYEKSHGDVDAVYHYISRARLGDRSIEELDEWDYDDEVWISEPMWLFCSRNPLDSLTEKFTEDYVEKLLEEAVVSKAT